MQRIATGYVDAQHPKAIDADLYRRYSETLRKAVELVGVDETLQDRWMANVSRFAAYKAADATRRIAEAVMENGALDDGLNPLHAHRRYLAAEANTARTRARTGKQWQQFNDDDRRRLFPNLRWVPSRSAMPREAHQLFWDKVWAKDDPFWQRNQPGTLWNCKCDWEETDDPVSTDEEKKLPNGRSVDDYTIKVRGLDGNPAETGQIFSDDAPYIRNAPKIELDLATREAHPHLQKLLDADTKQYRIDYYSDKGGILLSDKARIKEGNSGKQELQKFDKEHNMCRILAQNKYDVVYLQSRESYYDILIDGIPADLKKTKSHNHIVDYAKKSNTKAACQNSHF